MSKVADVFRRPLVLIETPAYTSSCLKKFALDQVQKWLLDEYSFA